MKTLSIDVETYSDINLSEAGAHRYCEDESFKLLLFAYSIDYGPVRVIDIADHEPIPKEVLTALTSPLYEKTAFNAAFERAVLSAYFRAPMPPEQWSCTMVLCAQAGLPLSLDGVSKAMALPEDKAKKDGKALIRYFCTPCRPTITNGGRTRNMPWDDYEKWDRFKEYNRRDVEVENTVRQKLLGLKPDAVEQKFWVLDQRINDKGVKIDLTLAKNAIVINDRYVDELTDRAVALSGIGNVKSIVQIKDWLKEQEGTEFESLNKKAMPDVLASLKTEEAKEFLALRSELSKTSVKKFDKMISCAGADDHARGLFQFYGASRTGRFAGRLLQLQNLPQNHLEDIADVRSLVRAGCYEELKSTHANISSTLSELIRTAIIPENGCRFIIADFSAIEARVIAWLAREADDLEEFRGAGKIYEQTASRMFGVAKDKIVKGNPEYELRAKGKVATLACGYGGGPTAMISMGALQSGLTEEELPALVKMWRDAHRNIVDMWGSLEAAAKTAVKTKASAHDPISGTVFSYERGNLFMILPSGRKLCYVNAKIGLNRFGNSSVVYMSQNQVTRKWEQAETYGGKLTENLVQATARDCLRDAMMRLDAAGFDIRMHIHDEVVINEPRNGRSLEEVIALMCAPSDWSHGLPLNAAGFESDFYMKD